MHKNLFYFQAAKKSTSTTIPLTLTLAWQQGIAKWLNPVGNQSHCCACLKFCIHLLHPSTRHSYPNPSLAQTSWKGIKFKLPHSNRMDMLLQSVGYHKAYWDHCGAKAAKVWQRAVGIGTWRSTRSWPTSRAYMRWRWLPADLTTFQHRENGTKAFPIQASGEII